MNLINKYFRTVGNISFRERKYEDCNVVMLNEINTDISVPDFF
jgi:hypothetical protein